MYQYTRQQICAENVGKFDSVVIATSCGFPLLIIEVWDCQQMAKDKCRNVTVMFFINDD